MVMAIVIVLCALETCSSSPLDKGLADVFFERLDNPSGLHMPHWPLICHCDTKAAINKM